MTNCKHCLWDIRRTTGGTWVLAWAGPHDDTDAAVCDGSSDGRHVPADQAGG